MAARLGHAGRCPRDGGGVRLDAAALAGERAAAARVRGLAAARSGRDAHAARDDRAALPAVGSPAPERRPGGMGAGSRGACARAVARAGVGAVSTRACGDPSARGAARLAALLVRLAPAGAVRHGAGTPELSPPPRAHELLRDRRAALVADRPQTPLGRWKGAVPLRRVCPRLAAGPAARSAPPPRLRLLRAGAAPLGARPPDRPADRGRDDGRGAGSRFLRRVCVLSRAFPADGGARRRVQRKPEISAPPATTSSDAAASRAPIASARRRTTAEITTAHRDSVP